MTKQTKSSSNPPKPIDEDDRLAALQSYQLLDTLPEAALDHITKAASEFCGTEISLISLVDESRQWFKSAVGLAATEVPRDVAFCAHAILQPGEILEVEDTELDPRFSANPLVTADPNIRFYAGMPLTTAKGYALGTLCVIDSEPKKLTHSQKEGLKHLSSAVIALFEERLSTTLTPLGRAIEESLSNGILIIDINQADNPITYCNRGFEKLSGYSREEIIGKNCRFLQGEDTDPVELEKLRKTIDDHQECKVTLKNYRKDGTSFWNELSISPVRNTEGRVTHLFGIQQDITLQIEAEERLLGFSSILEDSPNEIYIFDEASLNFIYVNKGARQNLGYEMDELSTMTTVDVQPAYTEEGFLKTIKPLASGEQKSIKFQTVHRRKDITDYLVEVHVQKMQYRGQSVFFSIARDITESTKNRLDLVQANAFLDSAPDATVVVDKSGNIQVSNKQMVELLGYSRNELKDMNVDELVPDRFRGGHAAHRKSFTSNPKVRGMGIGLDLSALTKDGREIPIEISLSPIKNADGNLVAAAIRDISARKAVEKELQLAKQAAEEATLAKSQFLAAASHDLRQPLQALRLYLSALTSKLDQPKQIQLSEKMNLSLDSMSELLDALLDISTLESGTVEPSKSEVSLTEFLEKIESLDAQSITDKGLKFVCSTIDCFIFTDPALLKRIIENYITNALRYTETGTISIDCQLHGEHVRVAVSDTGQGIPETELEAIFNDFYQLDNAVRNRSKGLGLGLSIVKNIARILDHQTHVTSTLGKGSTFSVDVPLAKSQVLLKHEDQSKKDDPRDSSTLNEELTFLVVDDDPTIVDAMEEVLSMLDINVVTAGHAAEALAHIQEGLEPDFVLTDYRMPEINGVELVIKIRTALNKEVPVVIMTGDTSAEKITAANLDNCTVLHKPVNIEKLMSLINR